MAQQNGGQGLSGNVSAATQQLLTKLEEDLPTIVSAHGAFAQRRMGVCTRHDVTCDLACTRHDVTCCWRTWRWRTHRARCRGCQAMQRVNAHGGGVQAANSHGMHVQEATALHGDACHLPHALGMCLHLCLTGPRGACAAPLQAGWLRLRRRPAAVSAPGLQAAAADVIAAAPPATAADEAAADEAATGLAPVHD